MKKTKIICSIGPATYDWNIFKDLVLNGMNVARINFSHADIKERHKVENLVKRANKELNSNVAILYDTKGPDLRTGNFKNNKIHLEKGKKIRIVENEVLGTEQRFSLNYRGILNKLEIGSKILIDDGFYKLEVISKEKDGVTCRILNTGDISSRRGVCFPGINLDIPFVSKEDYEDIKYACENDGDFIALSFVNSKENVQEVKKLCEQFGKPNMPIVSKIETKYAIDNLVDIVKVSDYIMIARGDLGVETGVENLPYYQQLMIDACHKYSKGVIMATQMMYSMKNNIRPTNAEVNDVSNAILSGCDAIMTSEETTVGKYPVETVKVMTTICESSEKITKYNLEDYELRGTHIHNTIAKCAVLATKELNIKAIAVSTLTGKTAMDVASLRPNSFIVATVTNPKVSRYLALKWGVYPNLVKDISTTDDLVNEGIEASNKVIGLNKKDLVLVIGNTPKDAHTNFMKIEEF